MSALLRSETSGERKCSRQSSATNFADLLAPLICPSGKSGEFFWMPHRSRGLKCGRNRLRVYGNLLKRFNLIWAVQSSIAEIFRFPAILDRWLAPLRPASIRGALRDRHERWVRDAMDALAKQDGRRRRGRRSRVVLTPRRWRQVGGSMSADDGGNRARSPGRARNKLLKPLRREGRVFPVDLW